MGFGFNDFQKSKKPFRGSSEYWLKAKNWKKIKPVMTARMKKLASKGFDAIEFDTLWGPEKVLMVSEQEIQEAKRNLKKTGRDLTQ